MNKWLFIFLMAPSVGFAMDGKYTIPDDELENFVKQNGYTDFIQNGIIGVQVKNPVSQAQWAVNTIDKFIKESIIAKASVTAAEATRTQTAASKEMKLNLNSGSILVDAISEDIKP